MNLRTTGVALVLVLLIGACEPVEDALEIDPLDVASDLVAAWNEEDFESISRLLDPVGPHRRIWHAGAMRVHFQEVLEQAAADDFEVAIEGEVDSSTFLYSVTYESAATRRPITLADGRLEFSKHDGEWFTEWSKRMPFAGHTRATGFVIKQRWPKRGAILDRTGARLALGSDGARRYPIGSVAGTTVGHLEPPAKNDLDRADRLVGASGLEAAFDKRLAGTADRRLLLMAGGQAVRTYGWIEGKPAQRLKTTLDVRIQRAAEGAFGGTTGGAVVLDPRSGDLLAAVSSSPFDPNNYVGAANVEPFNRALSGLYPPGSALKVMTASAALDTGKMKPSSTLTGPGEYRGVRNFESGEFGTIDFATALKYSVNTAFAQIALKLGSKKLFAYSNRFGFNSKPKMQLQAATSSFPKPLDEGDLMWGSIGQAQVLTTPVQMATVAATVANDGRRMEPRIDMSVEPTGERAITVRTARTMKELMRNVVTGGTGVAANVSGLDVAGKTGTAEVDVGGERKNHAWFICFAPASNPKVAVAVVSEYGGVGGQVAAPLARGILSAVWRYIR